MVKFNLANETFHFRYGFSEMYIMNECWNIQQIVFYFPKGSKLKEPFDAVLRRLRESGLISKWINDEMDKLARLQKTTGLDTREIKLSLDHLRAPFLLVLILYVITIATLCAEFVVKHNKKCFIYLKSKSFSVSNKF